MHLPSIDAVAQVELRRYRLAPRMSTAHDKAAITAGKPVVVVNQGRTRADAVLTLKVEHEVGAALEALLATDPEP